MKIAFENCSKDFANKCMELISREDMEDHNLHKVIFVGRLCKGLAEYTSTLKWKCPSSSAFREKVARSDLSGTEPEKKKLSSENTVAGIFLKAYFSIHEIWINYLVSNFEKSLIERFEADQWDREDIWTNLWMDHAVEAIESQENGECLKVPVYASHHLMKALFQVSESIQKMGAHDLDRSLLIMFSYLIGKSLCKVYGNLLSKTVPDKVNLQLLFDVYFIMKIFEGTWSLDSNELSEKLELKRSFQSLLQSFKAKVSKSFQLIKRSTLLTWRYMITTCSLIRTYFCKNKRFF